MQWEETPTYTVDTSVGPLRLIMTGRVSAYSDGPGPRHALVTSYPYEVNRKDAQAIRVNGVDYRAVRIRLVRNPDGWEADGYDAINGVRAASWGQDMTSAAARWLREHIVPEVIAWIGDHPEAIRASDIATARQAMHSLERSIGGLEAELATLRARYAMAEQEQED